MPRLGVAIGALALIYLQARLWLLPGNLRELAELEAQATTAIAANAAQARSNAEAEAWVRLLEADLPSIEYQARHELGLIRPDETLYLIPQ